MIWLTWRQFRTQGVVTGALLAALAVLFTVNGLHLSQLYADSGLPGCHTGCDRLTTAFLDEVRGGLADKLYHVGEFAAYLLPAIVGIFWGAPLIARELETGTYRLAWNQSVTRGRWLAVKLAGIGLASVVSAGLLSLMVNLWASPIDKASADRMAPDVFGARGIVILGYAAFAFALGVAAGVLTRRSVVAMAVTMALVVLALVAAPLWIRPHLMTPVRSSIALDVQKIHGIGTSDNGREMRVDAEVSVPGAWVLSNTTTTSDGRPFTGPADLTACGRDSAPTTCFHWIASLHLRQSVSYQPKTRFWALQWRETVLYLAAAALLAGLSVWWVRRRTT